MATSHSPREFGRRIALRGRGVRQEVERAIRKATLRADQVAVLATPVDTGRARANWIASTLAPADRADNDPDPSGQKAVTQAAAVVASYKLEFGSIYLTNNVEYIVPLENGHSAQAPAGMTQQAIAAARDVMAKAKVLLGD
jgi:hypothetical protein